MVRLAVLTMLTGSIVAGVTATNWSRPDLPLQLDWNVIPEPPHLVQVEQPTRARITRSISAPGIVEPVGITHVTTRRPGRVLSVEVEDGDEVESGQVVVRLDDERAEERLEDARQRLERLDDEIPKLDSAFQNAETDLALNRQYVRSGYQIPATLLDAPARAERARAELDVLRAERKAAANTIEELKTLIGDSILRAPIGGVIDEVMVHPGDQVIPAQGPLPPLLKVLDLSRIRVVAFVDEADAHLVQVGQRARVAPQSAPEKVVSARVERVSRRGKLAGEVVGFRAVLVLDDAETRLQVGMRASVEIDVEEVTEVLSVPVQAVVHRRVRDLPDTQAIRSWIEPDNQSTARQALDPSLQYLKTAFVIENRVARVLPVETGISDRRRVAIVRGLPPDASVVVGPFRALDELRDGDLVEIQTPETTVPAVEGS